MVQMYIESKTEEISIHLTGVGSVMAVFSMLMTAKFNDDINTDRLFGVISNDLLKELATWLSRNNIDVVDHSTAWVHGRFAGKIMKEVIAEHSKGQQSAAEMVELARLAFYPTPVPADILGQIDVN